jgi:molybdopterin-guanine dinucleotide biosynthesis protein A
MRRDPTEGASAHLAGIGGLLIAGGRSLRFGEEKAMSTCRGVPLMDASARVFSDLTAYAVSARPQSGAARYAQTRRLPLLHDDPNAPSGPLAGVLAGLRWARRQGFDYLATAPCDVPLIPRDLVSHLAEAIGAAQVAYAVTAQGEHPLCALWRVDLADDIAQRLQAGEHPAVRAVLAASGARAVRFADARAFANANTKAELAALERRP